MPILLALIANCVISGCVARTLAANKGYEGYFWTGFLLSVIGVVYVAGLPLSEEMRERELRELIEKLRSEGVLSGESASSGGSVPSGGSAPFGGSASSGGSVPFGGGAPSGGSVPFGGSASSGGSVPSAESSVSNRTPEPPRGEAPSAAGASFAVPKEAGAIFNCPACGVAQRSDRSV